MTIERWPVILAVGLAVVVLVNGGMVWLAITHAPTIETSYQTARDR